ncbi:MAG: hypothetical protein MRERV_40c010 [Mycoplasmataceae bacterium RV_VA103A]|nr:MAG: hypothetical protein MRERV_40c010 [Mycoplasmataceae bacterium RV_VA103A]
MFKKKNIWKSLLITLLINNLAMLVIWTIMSAFGYNPHYLMSFVIHNVLAILFWLARIIDY